MSGKTYAAQAAAAAFAEFCDEFRGLATPERLREILAGRWITTVEVLDALGVDRSRARLSFVSATIAERGGIRQKRWNMSVWSWGGMRERTAPAGPSLMPGRGEKRDCARYGSCLTALTNAMPHTEQAHCPTGCAFFVEPSRAAALEAAVADVGAMKRGAQWGAW